jgi:fructuronate reductase
VRLTRDGRAAPPVRLVHLGLGNFFRAHPAWYTAAASDEWGIAAFTGRSSPETVEALNAQDGLYTLISRAADRDRFEVVGAIARAHVADEHAAWLRYFEDPQVAAVTITVTEAGYLRDAGGGLDAERPEVAADLDALRGDPAALVRTTPVRLLAGLAARHRAGGAPIAVVSCDNVAGNGPIVRRVVRDAAERAAPGVVDWLDESVSFVTTMVDRITPRTNPEDVRAVAEETGREDRSPVVTEPFREWVLSGDFGAGRPPWEDAGATFTDDVTPFEHRKLWLLNGAHSLLAYAGSIRGHATVAEAVADDTCRGWLEQWWTEASRQLGQPDAELAAYRAALLERFANAHLRDRLDRIAADGTQKLPIRIVPVLRAERSAGRLPEGAVRVLAAWVCHLRGLGAPVTDARADDVVPLAVGELDRAVPRILGALDPGLGEDADVVAAVVDASEQLGRHRARDG